MSQPVCPYCRMPIETAQDATRLCPVCATPHHEDCWQENGGCTVFGCAAAPIEEVLVRVSEADLHASPAGHPAASLSQQPRSLQPASSDHDTTGVPPPPAVFRPPLHGSSGTLPSDTADPYGNSLPHHPVQSPAQVERQTYVWLAVFCGYLGVHNLYANRTSAGIIQLCATVLSCFLAIPVTWIWALVEAATIDRDGTGYPMR